MKRFRAAALALILAFVLPLAACAGRAEQSQLASCTISVICDNVLDNLDDLDPDKREIIPDDGVLLRPIKVEFSEGETAYDAFTRTARTAKLQFESDGDGENAYLTGIGNLYAGDCGAYSGWFFEVNGELPDVGCGVYELSDGDEVVFRYVCDYMAEFEE